MSDDATPAPAFPPVPLEPPGFQMRFEPPHRLTDRVTAEDALFLIAHLGVARVDPAAWRLEIGGLVERPFALDFDAIRRLPKRPVESFHHCAGDPRDHQDAKRLVGNVVWGGADLADLLHGAGIRPEAAFLWAYGLDRGQYEGLGGGNFAKDMPLARLAEGGVLLAYEINGEALSAERGFPLRLVIPGYYGTNDVKWLCRLELAGRRAGGVFTTVLYNDPTGPGGTTSPLWEAPPQSAIVSPAPAARLGRDPVEIWGWAWAAKGVARVELSADGGENWSGATLEPRSQWSWQRFLLRWTPPAAGDFTLMARATDTLGTVQRMSRARNAVHIVPVEIADA